MRKSILLIVSLSAFFLLQCQYAKKATGDLNKVAGKVSNPEAGKDSNPEAEKGSSSEAEKSSSSETKRTRKEAR